MDSVTNIVVRLQIAGLHCWPDVPADLMPVVGYLKYSHRHTFFIECRKEVSHADRDIEIINFKSQIIDYLNDKYFKDTIKCLDFGAMSCEMIAQQLLDHFILDYCQVLEDNENGGEVFRVYKREQNTQPLPLKVEKQVLFISSYLCSGKSFIAEKLAQSLGGIHIEVSSIVKSLLNASQRHNLQGHPELDQDIIKVLKDMVDNFDGPVVISGVRQVSILEAFPQASCMWLDVDPHIRLKRWLERPEGQQISNDFNKTNYRDIELGLDDVKKYMTSKKPNI